MPKPIKKKAVKKAAVEAEAKDYIVSARSFYSTRKKQIQIAVVAIVIVALGSAGALFYLRSAALKAGSLFSQGYTRYIAALPQNDSDRLREALEAFKKAYENRKSPLILYYESDIYERLGEFDNAESSLLALIQGYPSDRRVLPLAYVKLGMLYRGKGDYEKALDTLAKLQNSDLPFFRDLALYQRAAIYAQLGKTDEAKQASDELRKLFPASPYAEQADDRDQPSEPGADRKEESSGVK